MSRTYRALAIVAVAVTVVSLVATFTFEPGAGGWFSYAQLNPGAQFQSLLIIAAQRAWQTTTTIAPPIVATFGAIVAAQGRYWIWLGVFIALGLLGLYGGSALSPLTIALDSTWSFTSNPLTTGALLSVIAQALPAIAALLFVATTSRPARINSERAIS